MQLKGFVKRVIDGDTVDVLIDLPLDVYKLERVRLLGINAPEVTTVEGLNSKKHLIDLINNKEVLVIIKESAIRDKYGRLLAYITCDSINVNNYMLDKGYAVCYQNQKK